MSAFKTWLNGLTSKTTPVDADEMYLRDSVGAASNKVTWANLKATLLTYFDTAYLKLTGGTLAGGTVTASSPVLTTTQTWNNAGVTFVGKSNEFTDTASASASLLEDWKVGGSSKFSISKTGGISSYNDATNSFTLSSSGSKTSLSAVRGIDLVAGGGWSVSLVGSGGVAISSGSGSTYFFTGAANTLAQRNGTYAQTSLLFGTYTDDSNGRWLEQSMTTAGVAVIKPTGNGTGASGNVLHISGLPTSNPGAGILWNDSGTVKVGT